MGEAFSIFHEIYGLTPLVGRIIGRRYGAMFRERRICFMNKYKTPALKKVFIILLLTGFLFMEFPGVFFFKNVAEPFIFNMPFVYGYILICWAFMCVVLFIAYRTNWGDKREKTPIEKGKGGAAK